MTKAALTQLIPIAELTPGMVASIRNSVIEKVVSLASEEMGVPEENLVVRDIQAYTDLGWNFSTATVGTNEGWIHEMTYATGDYRTVTGATVMGDQRFVAIFGVRDGRIGRGATDTATDTLAGLPASVPSLVSLVKIEVGGAIRAIWDLHSIGAYVYQAVGLTPGAVIIPQNTPFEIFFYPKAMIDHDTGHVSADSDLCVHYQMLGVTVEPRGLVVSP